MTQPDEPQSSEPKTRTLGVTDCDESLMDSLRQRAIENERSMAAEARYILRKSLGLTNKETA